MINFKAINQFTHFSDWVEGAIRQHKKYQRWQNVFGGRKGPPQKPFGQNHLSSSGNKNLPKT